MLSQHEKSAHRLAALRYGSPEYRAAFESIAARHRRAPNRDELLLAIERAADGIRADMADGGCLYRVAPWGD
jgi:hypothetical protein